MKAYNLQTAIQNPEKTTELYIHNRNLQEIPEAVYELKNLRVLGLSQNKISELSDRVGELLYLEELDLSANEFEVFPVKILTIQRLKKLNFSDNQLSEIPEAIGDLKKLEDFNGARNDLKTIPDALFSLALKKLNLSENQIIKIPAGIKRAGNLQMLFLQKNKIGGLPKSILHCQSLSVLNLDANNIKILPEGFGSLNRLEKVMASNNKLSLLPDSIGNCTFLRELDLSQNKIQSLPVSIEKLKWLVRLNLRKNKLQELPSNFGKLSKIRRLNLEYNLLEKLPDSWTELLNLTHLLLKGNTIAVSKNAVLELGKLQKITGLNQVFSSAERRQLLSFLKHCRQQKTTLVERQNLYQLLTADPPLSKLILIKSLRFPIKEIRRKALYQLLQNHNPAIPLNKGSVLTFCGRSHLNKARIVEQLQLLSVDYQRQISNKTTHIILGDYPKIDKLLRLNPNISFLSEQELQAIIINKSGKEEDQFSISERENLSRLLLSEQEQNISVAIQILKNTNVPTSIITELFIAYKSTRLPQHKRELKALIEINASRKLAKNTSLRLRLDKDLQETELVKNIDRFTNETELDREKIIRYFRK